MRRLTLRFLVAGLLLLVVSRLGLVAWQWTRVSDAHGFGAVMLGGLRIDLAMLGMMAVLPTVLAPWFGHRPLAVRLTAWWFRLCWFLLCLLEVSTPQFMMEYDTRPNRLYFEYLRYPAEIGGMLWQGYKVPVLCALIVLGLLMWLGFRLFRAGTPDRRLGWGWRPVMTVVGAALMVLAIRGTLEHRPINPSTVAFSSDAMVNALALNSFYSVTYAAYRTADERSSQSLYGKMDDSEVLRIVREAAGLPQASTDPDIPTLHAQQASVRRDRPLSLVIILEESLGAQYVSSLGGRNLTPSLDALGQQGWMFGRAYATGTRSARGLETVSAGFFPTPAEAVLKLPRAQTGFFTLAQLLGRHGYGSRFLYGGEAHFDNMSAFFLGNGFKEVVDQSKFVSPKFVGSWGASDEDMFAQLDRLLQQDGNTPMFTLAFSVSNHTPWEYPKDSITPEGRPDTVENAVRYADWSLGKFFETARTRPYWQNTVFLIVADHDARAGGASLVPVHNFHIPALILGADVAPRRDNRLMSQADLAPTLLSLIGMDTEHPMLGQDLTVRSPDRAIMQYADNFGYLKGDQLIVLEPGGKESQFRYVAPQPGQPEAYQPETLDPQLAREALAHSLWPSNAYLKEQYRLPADPRH